jgi:hypothetical protein
MNCIIRGLELEETLIDIHHLNKSFYFIFYCCAGWEGVRCGIYKSSYNISNISYLTSPPPSFSFITILYLYEQVILKLK